jgi:Zn-dependent M28 family amino/carboxypeptidase
MKRNLLALFLLTAFLIPTGAFGQTAVKLTPEEKKIAEGVTAKQLSDYLYFVASDVMEGRNTPSRGLDTTARFIGMNLSKWGFKPAGDDGTFYQKIALHRDVVDTANTSVEVGGQKYSYGDDVVRVSGTSTGAITAPIVFAGNGWMIKSKNLNPYQNIDVKGKWIAVYGEGQPSFRNIVPLPTGVTAADTPQATRGTDWADAAIYARANGAAGVIVLPSQALASNWAVITQNFGRTRVVVDKLQPAPSAQSMAPVVLASPKLAAAIFTGESANPLAGATTSFGLSAGKTFTFNLTIKPEQLWTQNVVAIWEGSDPVLKNEMVAIGAHYDHVGNSPETGCRPVNGDSLCNGADDDGSGTVSVLSIAEAISHAPKHPKRSILFVWHCGEEKGLWGSDYFNKFPTVDIKQVIAQLNIDMIGRSKKEGDTEPKDKDLSGENAIYVIGKDMMSSTLGSVVDGTNKGYLNLTYDTRYDDPKDTNRFFFRSDHFNYALNGIPITFWFDGVHVDYHQPGDEPSKIDYNKMEKVARTILLTALELTDLKERPKIDKQLPPELSQR